MLGLHQTFITFQLTPPPTLVVHDYISLQWHIICNDPNNTRLHPLYKVFNSAARLVSRTLRFSPTSPSLVLLHWLPLKYRVMFKICLKMCKIKNKISPVYLNNSIRVPNRSGLRSSSFNHNSIYRVKHSFAKRSFSHSGEWSISLEFFTIFTYFD